MDLEERLDLVADLILHPCRKGEMQRLARYRLEIGSNALDVIVNEDRSLIDRQLLSACILSEAAVVSNEMSHVLCSCLHSEEDRAMHQGDVLRLVRQIFHAAVHRELDVYDVAFLPFPVYLHI